MCQKQIHPKPQKEDTFSISPVLSFSLREGGGANTKNTNHLTRFVLVQQTSKFSGPEPFLCSRTEYLTQFMFLFWFKYTILASCLQVSCFHRPLNRKWGGLGPALKSGKTRHSIAKTPIKFQTMCVQEGGGGDGGKGCMFAWVRKNIMCGNVHFLL